MVIDLQDMENECPCPSGLGITIHFPRVHDHFDIDPTGISPIIL